MSFEKVIDIWISSLSVKSNDLMRASLKAGLVQNLSRFKERIERARGVFEDFSPIIPEPEALKKGMEEGKPFYVLLGISQDKLNEYYKKATELFYKEEYEKSSDAFYFLSSLHPSHPHYWLGLGLSEQKCGEFHAALMAYGMASIYDVENPLSYFQAAKCYLEIEDRENASYSLKLALSFSENNPTIKTRCQELLRIMDRRI